MNDLSHHVARAWRCLGVPTTANPFVETEEGVIDPEALLLVTLAHVTDARIREDAVIWASANADLLLAHKLSTLSRRLPAGAQLRDGSRYPELALLPPKLRGALGLSAIRKRQTDSRARAAKFSPRSFTAQHSRMIHNRLLFGVSVRADVITNAEMSGPSVTPTALAELLCADRTALWRIQRDLRDCGALKDDGRIATRVRLPGYFVSSHTATNLFAIADAHKMTDPALRREMMPKVVATLDGLSHALLNEIEPSKPRRTRSSHARDNTD